MKLSWAALLAIANIGVLGYKRSTTTQPYHYTTTRPPPPKCTTTITRTTTITLIRETQTSTATVTYTQPGGAVTVTQSTTITPTSTETSTSTITEVAATTSTTTTITTVSTIPAGQFTGVRDSLPQATYDPALLFTPGSRKRATGGPVIERALWPKEKWWKRQNAATTSITVTETSTEFSTATTISTTTATVSGTPTQTQTVTSTETAPAVTSTVVVTSKIVPPVFTSTSTAFEFTATVHAACNTRNIANAVQDDGQAFPIQRISSGLENQVSLGTRANGLACCEALFNAPYQIDEDDAQTVPASAGVFAWDSESQACVGYYHSSYNCTTQRDDMNNAVVRSSATGQGSALGMVVGNGMCGYIGDFQFSS